MARDHVLQKIRTALGRAPGEAVPPLPPPLLGRIQPSDLPALFTERFEALGGKLIALQSLRDFCAGQSVVASNAPVLRELGILEWPNVQSGFENGDLLRQACATSTIGITGADYALAETGTLVKLASPHESRLISLLPPAHIAIVRRDCLISDFDELMTRLPHPAGQTSSMVLITGPSRTGDIELTLVRGVHGPGDIYVVLV